MEFTCSTDGIVFEYLKDRYAKIMIKINTLLKIHYKLLKRFSC